MTTVEYSGITIDEGFGDGFHLSRLIGWDDGAPTSYEAVKRPQAHGTFRPGTIYRNARVVSVEGTWSGRSMEDAYRARRELAAIMADGQETPFVVTDLLGTTEALAGVVAAPTVTDQMFSPFFRFSFDVVSADSFRYGPERVDSTGLPYAGSGIVWPLGAGDVSTEGLYQPTSFVRDPENPEYYLTTGLTPAEDGLYLPPVTQSAPWINWGTPGSLGRVVTPNDGTAETYSVLEVTGGMSLGFLLTWIPTGQLISFDREVPAGSTITLDPRRGLALIDDQSDVSGYLTISDWWAVPPGGTGSIQFASKGTVTGTPTLTARTAPALI